MSLAKFAETLKTSLGLWVTKFGTLRFKASDLIAVLLLIDIACLLFGAIQLIYRDTEFNLFISAPASDRPALTWNLNYDWSDKSIGRHYFGDFLQPYYWATLRNPWTHSLHFLAQYPPVAIFILKPLVFLPYKMGLVVYLASLLISSMIAVWLMAKNFSFGPRLLLVVTFGIATTTFLSIFDRGNVVGLITVAYALFIISVLKGKKSIASMLLVLMVSIKIYPVLFLVVFMKKKWWKEFWLTIFISGALALTLFAISPGDLFETLHYFVRANLNGSALTGGAMVDQFAAFSERIFDTNRTNSLAVANYLVAFLSTLRYALLGIIGLILIFRSKISDIHLILLASFAVSIVYSAQLTYNWFWVPVMCVWILNDFSKRGRGYLNIKELWARDRFSTISLFGLTFMILPLGLHLPGVFAPITPLLGLFVAFVAVISFLRNETKENQEIPVK